MKNSDYFCELLSPIEPGEAPGYLDDERYLMQEKLDGFRLTVEHQAGLLRAWDRYGQVTAVPQRLKPVLQHLMLCDCDYMIDGELLGLPDNEQYVVWDLLELDGQDLREVPYGVRWKLLGEQFDICGELADRYVALVATWQCGEPYATARIRPFARTALRMLHQQGAEGVCFKDTLAIFEPGRAQQHFKLKFWETATCRVADKRTREDARLDRHSVALELCERVEVSGRLFRPAKTVVAWRPMGFLSIPQSQALPPVGAIVEVRYLYAQPTGLYQGVYLGIRKDARAADCTLEQLKWQPSSSQLPQSKLV